MALSGSPSTRLFSVQAISEVRLESKTIEMDEFEIAVFQESATKFLSDNVKANSKVGLIITSVTVVSQTVVSSRRTAESVSEVQGRRLRKDYLEVKVVVSAETNRDNDARDFFLGEAVKSSFEKKFSIFLTMLQEKSTFFLQVTLGSLDPDKAVGGSVGNALPSKTPKTRPIAAVFIALGVVGAVVAVAVVGLYVRKRRSYDDTRFSNRDSDINGAHISQSGSMYGSRRPKGLTVLDSLEFSASESSPQYSNYDDGSRGSNMFPFTPTALPASRTWDREVNQHFVSQFSPGALMDRSNVSNQPCAASVSSWCTI
jgi:hypothetical protein